MEPIAHAWLAQKYKSPASCLEGGQTQKCNLCSSAPGKCKLWLRLHLKPHPCLASALSLSCFPPLLTGLSREPFLDKSLAQDCLTQGLLLGEPDLRCVRQALGSPAVCKPHGPSAPEFAGKSPSSPKFISWQTSLPLLKVWGPPLSWTFCPK